MCTHLVHAHWHTQAHTHKRARTYRVCGKERMIRHTHTHIHTDCVARKGNRRSTNNHHPPHWQQQPPPPSNPPPTKRKERSLPTRRALPQPQAHHPRCWLIWAFPAVVPLMRSRHGFGGATTGFPLACLSGLCPSEGVRGFVKYIDHSVPSPRPGPSCLRAIRAVHARVTQPLPVRLGVGVRVLASWHPNPAVHSTADPTRAQPLRE